MSQRAKEHHDGGGGELFARIDFSIRCKTSVFHNEVSPNEAEKEGALREEEKQEQQTLREEGVSRNETSQRSAKMLANMRCSWQGNP